MALTQVSRGLLSTSIVDNGNATAITIDSSENVGIGTSSPSDLLDISANGTSVMRLSDSSSPATYAQITQANGVLTFAADAGNAQTGSNMQFEVDGSEAMRIDSSGNVGIGTTSPDEALEVSGDLKISGSNFGIVQFGETSDQTKIVGRDSSHASLPNTMEFFTNSVNRMFIDSSGNVIVGGTVAQQAGSVTLEGDGDVRGILSSGAGGDTVLSAISGVSNGYQISVTTGNAQTYKWHNGGTQSMTLDSSGNLLVGTTTNSSSVAGVTAGNSGLITACRSSNYSAIFNRLSTNGAIADFRKDGTTVGSIGTTSAGNFAFFSPSEGGIETAAVGILPMNNGVRSDNETDLGFSGARFKDLYLSGTAYAGNLLVGTTSLADVNGLVTNHLLEGANSTASNGAVGVYNNTGTANAPALVVLNRDASTDTSNRFVQFYANVTSSTSTGMGGIVGNGASNVQFASISDVREKENITTISGSLSKINSLNPVEFDWIASGERCKAGFVAQEVEAVFPEFVVENMASEGQEERKGLTGGMTGGIVAHLVKAIQEQQETITALTARIETLENN